MCSGAFFFFAARTGLGTPESDCVVCSDSGFEAGSLRRELKEEMNSIDCGDSPRRFLK